jgi:2'-5' RNA ligase
VGEPARAALAKAVEPLRAAHPGIWWAEPDRWCIEVCSLGAVAAGRLDDVDEVVADAASDNPQVVLRLDGAAGSADGRALFAVVCHSEALVALRGDLIDRFDAVGLRVVRSEFLPHCVIGRVPGGIRLPPVIARSFSGPMVTWIARRLLVVRTRLRLGGVAHEVRSRHTFGSPVAALP